MSILKNAALFGLAASQDRNLFAPVAAPMAPYAATAYGSAPVYSVPADAYAMSAEAFAQPLEVAQPIEYVPAEPVDTGADSQLWLWTGAGALALLGAAAARRQPSSVANLDEADLESGLESARIATLFMSGKKGGNARKERGFNLGEFLMSGRKDRTGRTNNELELLSGATRTAIDDPTMLKTRFQIGYDTRSREAKRQTKEKKQGPVVAWRSKNPQSNLYGTGAGGSKKR